MKITMTKYCVMTEDLKQIDSFVTDGYAFSEKTERLF